MAALGYTKDARIDVTGAPTSLAANAATATIETPSNSARRDCAVDAKPRAITRLELCALVVNLTREVATLRRELEATKAEHNVAVAELAVARSYRQIVSAAMSQLHERSLERARERASYYRLLDDYRTLRGKGPTATGPTRGR